MQLVELRKAAGKSLAEVARDLDTTPSTVNRHERGLTPMSGFHRTAYGIYFGVKADTIEQPKPKRAKAAKPKKTARRKAA